MKKIIIGIFGLLIGELLEKYIIVLTIKTFIMSLCKEPIVLFGPGVDSWSIMASQEKPPLRIPFFERPKDRQRKPQKK